MRKKYLSALLFGALLLASAGTFTSCKDYDDDIKNLQEQINTVKTSLDELTTKVNNLGAGIKDFKYENGQLVIVTDKDTNFTVDLPACEGITNLEIKDGVLYADGKAVGSVAGDGGSVVEVKDGVIYIDGEAKAEIGNKVAIVDNGNGTYTLTVDGKEYTLPKAVAADVTVKVKANNDVFSQWGNTENEDGGIYWGTAAKDAAWDGPKGAVKAGQFLVGAISTPVVTVTPATTELDKMDLKLVDSEGVYAPVSIKAVAKSGDVIVSGRATSASGEWVLVLTMDETVNEKNAGTIFTANVNKKDLNKCYALSCDGRLLSGYEIVVDTKEEITKSEAVESALKGKFDLGSVYVDGESVKSTTIGDLSMETSIQLAYNHPQVYDYKYTISAADQNDAEKYGITLENNVLKGAATAANQSIVLDLTVMGVNGVTYTYEKAVTVAFTSTVVDAEELAATSYKVPVNAAENGKYSIVINLENTFSGLSAAQAVAVNKGEWALADGEENTYLVDGALVNSSVKYYSDAKCENEILTQEGDNNFDGVDNIKNIKYAKFTFTKFNADAEVGAHKLQFVLTNKAGDQIKKVIAPVNVTIPAFDEMFTKSAAWNEGVAQLRLTYAGVAEAMTLYKTAAGFNDKYAVITYDKVDNKAIIDNELAGTITPDMVNDKHGLKSTKAELTYSFANVEGFTVKSGKFDVNFISCLEGAVIKNYKQDDKGNYTVETPFVVNGDKAEFAGAKIELNGKSDVLDGVLKDIIDLEANEYAFSFDSKAGNNATARVENGKLIVSGLAANKYETTLTITYKKAVNVEGKAVYVSMPIKIQVNN